MPARYLAARRPRGQASDKPQGRKPRGGEGKVVPRGSDGDLGAPAVGSGVGVGTAGKAPLCEIAVAERAGATNELRLPSPRV
jgi:hypothetical protein